MQSWMRIPRGLYLALLFLAAPTTGLSADKIEGEKFAQSQTEASETTTGGDADDVAFLAENKPVMDRMMVDMNITSSGDVDRDFVGMMIPHHQGAIDMAVLELRHGRNEQLRRIAQEIIVGQQQEIVAMHLALGQKLPPSEPAPTGSVQMQMPMTH